MHSDQMVMKRLTMGDRGHHDGTAKLHNNGRPIVHEDHLRSGTGSWISRLPNGISAQECKGNMATYDVVADFVICCQPVVGGESGDGIRP